MIKNLSLVLLGIILSVQSLKAQTYYTENFESGNGTSWVYTDLDADGNNFVIANASGLNAAFGVKSLASFSYTSTLGALTPNNLVTSPAIVIPTGGSNLFLTYNVLSASSYGAEHYAVYVTEVNASGAVIATTPVLEETLPAIGSFSVRSINISSFLGKTIYLSFRHFNCTDENYLVLDNISMKTLQSNDATFVSASIDKFILQNTQYDLKVDVKNSGADPISSVEINWNDGTDHIATIAGTVAAGATYTFTHPTKVNYATANQHAIAVTVSKVNNATDPNPADNVGNTSTTVISQVSPKKVFFEEGTGTWCGWCPRGAVAADYVTTTYPNDQTFVAVHNGSTDAMLLPEYNTAAGITSFPGMNVDRVLKGVSISPTTIGNYVNTRKVLLTPVALSGTYSITGTSLVATGSAQFYSNFDNANYRLAAIVSEDNVHGTTSGYNQTNYYSGGGSGAMGGYESLANPVPAASMVYNHVGRALLGGYSGQVGSVPTVITNAQIVNYTFNYTIPATMDPTKIHVVLVLVDQTDGSVLNSTNLAKTILAVKDNTLDNSISVYPNPATTEFNIKLTKNGKYDVAIYDLSGRIVADYGSVKANDKLINLPIKLESGKYIVNISQDGVSFNKDLLVK